MDSTLQQKGAQIAAVAKRHGVRNVRVFGSAARDEAGPESDVDVLVELEPGRTLLDLVAFKQDLEDLLGTEVDVVTERAVSPYMRDEILGTAVAL